MVSSWRFGAPADAGVINLPRTRKCEWDLLVSEQHTGLVCVCQQTDRNQMERSSTMTAVADFSLLCQSFFSKRLITQRKASSHTVSAYAKTFRLFIAYAQKRLRTSPAMLSLAQLDASFVAEFLDNLESSRSNGARSRNARLASLRSFYHYAALEAPQHASLIHRVLPIPSKRLTRRLVNYLTRPEIEAVLATVDKSTWVGRRNHALLLVAMQTGLRLSEITGLRQRDVVLGRGAHVRCEGKGRKERCTPLAKPTAVLLQALITQHGDEESHILFPRRPD